jgi:hypothetical protein
LLVPRLKNDDEKTLRPARFGGLNQAIGAAKKLNNA